MKLPARRRTALYSGRYLPACLISQIGLRAVASRRNARRKQSFSSVEPCADAFTVAADWMEGPATSFMHVSCQRFCAQALQDCEGRARPVVQGGHRNVDGLLEHVLTRYRGMH